MTEKEAQKVLDELNTVRIEVLNDEAKRLFEAIMKIADSRDELQKTVEEKDKQIEQYQNMLVTNDMIHVKESEEKDKIIDLMSKEILKLDIKRAGIIYDYPRIWENETGIKQYFENKAKGE